MFTPLVANPPSALNSAAGTLRTRNTSVVISGLSPGSGPPDSRASTRNRVVL